MKSRHVRPLPLLAFCEGELTADAQRHVAEHLTDCPVCKERERRLARSIQLVQEFSQELTALVGLSPQEQLQQLKEQQDPRTPETCELLSEKAFEAGFDEPARAVALAHLAVSIVDSLPGSTPGVIDLRARCCAFLGNSRRVLGDLSGADEAFRRAEGYLAESMTGNLHVRAEVTALKVSLRRDQRRFDEALVLADETIGQFQTLGESHQVGRASIKKAIVLEEMGDLCAAIELLKEAGALIDAQREPRLAFCARKNLLVLLIDAGDYAQAEALLPDVRSLLDERHPLERVRLAWTEGRIALGLGRLGAAEGAFRDVQREFFERGMGYDAALVSLDLAILYAQEGCTVELKQLAAEILPVFESREVHREAMAALLMFQHAAEEESLTLELARHLADFLKRERRRNG